MLQNICSHGAHDLRLVMAVTEMLVCLTWSDRDQFVPYMQELSVVWVW